MKSRFDSPHRSDLRVELRCAQGLVSLATLLTVEVATARSDGSLCEGADVRVEGQPDPRWSEAIAQTCADLMALSDRDLEASIHLFPRGEDLMVEVSLADGRSAIRRVARPPGLRRALEALVVLPPAPPSPMTREAPSSPSALVERPAPMPSPIGAELALSAMGRAAGAGFFSAGGAAEAYLATQHWLFGLSARWEAFQTDPAPKVYDYSIETVGAGVAFARRFTLGPSLEVDLGFSPRLLAETESYEIPPPSLATTTDADDDDDRTRTTTDVRLAPFARALFGRGPVRFFAGLDAEVSPARLRRKVRAEAPLPALPAWSAGIAAGISWSAQ